MEAIKGVVEHIGERIHGAFFISLSLLVSFTHPRQRNGFELAVGGMFGETVVFAEPVVRLFAAAFDPGFARTSPVSL